MRILGNGRVLLGSMELADSWPGNLAEASQTSNGCLKENSVEIFFFKQTENRIMTGFSYASLMDIPKGI